MSLRENYGDIHLHHAGYPGAEYPHSCGSGYNYEHGNLCGADAAGAEGAVKNGHAYDCHCNLCQPPYSLPYHPGPGGHLGGLSGLKPCGNPYCKCTDCDGRCKCGAAALVEKMGVSGRVIAGAGVGGGLNLDTDGMLTYGSLLVLVLIGLWLLMRKR